MALACNLATRVVQQGIQLDAAKAVLDAVESEDHVEVCDFSDDESTADSDLSSEGARLEATERAQKEANEIKKIGIRSCSWLGRALGRLFPRSGGGEGKTFWGKKACATPLELF